jgi:hypothetical protein
MVAVINACAHTLAMSPDGAYTLVKTNVAASPPLSTKWSNFWTAQNRHDAALSRQMSDSAKSWSSQMSGRSNSFGRMMSDRSRSLSRLTSDSSASAGTWSDMSNLSTPLAFNAEADYYAFPLSDKMCSEGLEVSLHMTHVLLCMYSLLCVCV